MTLRATISYPYDDKLLTLFAAETQQMTRASYTVARTEDTLSFTVEAADATALRACLTTITKVLSVWESTALHGGRA